MDDDPIEEAYGVGINMATAAAQVAETLTRARQQQTTAQQEMRRQFTEDSHRSVDSAEYDPANRYPVQEALYSRAATPDWLERATPRETAANRYPVQEALYSRAATPDWLERATPRETAETWLSAQHWGQIRPDGFGKYAKAMSINFEAKYELDLDWVSDDLGSFYLAAELAEARVIRYRENPSDYRSQDPAVIAFLKKNGLNTAALEARAKADRLNGVNPTKPAAAGQGKSARWWRALRQNQRGTERGE